MNFYDANRFFGWERQYYLLYILPKVPQSFLSFRAREGFLCVHQILSHIMLADDWWFYTTYLRKPLDPETYNFEGKTAQEIIGVMENIRSDELSHLEKLGDVDYHKIKIPYCDEPGEISLAGVVYHIAEHESYHMGQIFMLADLAGIKLASDHEDGP